MSEQVYIHYGHSLFDKDLFQPPKNREYFNKPIGGLWASPVNAKYGWKQWNEESDYVLCEESNSFKFTMADAAKVFHIYSKADILKLPTKAERSIGIEIDFEKAAAMYDAIQCHLSDEIPPENWHDGLYWSLYGWDCDSIIMLNKESVVPL